MTKAFLSHSSVDKIQIRKIKNKIGRLWTYFDEDSFEPGEDFREAILKRLEDIDLFVLFVSKNSLNSSWVNYEIDEAYWQSIKRNDIQILVLTLEDISVSQLPEWMRKFKFEKVTTPYLAAEVIKRMLFESVDINNELYLGRETDISRFYAKIAEFGTNFPNIIAVTGLNGIGRHTFIKDILKKRFSINYSVEFELLTSDGLIELYRKLLDDNIELLESEEKEKYYNAFLNLEEQKRAEEIARLLSMYIKQQACPILIDSGAMLNDDGYYKQDFLDVLKYFKDNSPESYLILIHTRIPKLERDDTSLMYIHRINALDQVSCYSLFDSLLKKNEVPVLNRDEVYEISEYLEGYPPAVFYATRECALEGVSVVCSDKRNLVDFQTRAFSKYFDKLELSNLELELLTAIHNVGNLSIQQLSIILEKPEKAIAESMSICVNYNIIDICSNGLYTISPPIRATVNRKVDRYDKEDFSRVAKLLIDKLWKTNDDSSFASIDIIINSILRSGQEKELLDFKQFILPSHLLKAAEKANQDMEWPLTENYARKALELDESLSSAWELLFKALVRQETSQNLKDHNDEENKILSKLKTLNDKNYYYLRGFRLLKRNKFHDAIKEFELAKESGDDSISMHRDLAECYYQINDMESAQKEIDDIMQSRKINNPFILDLASKIAISMEDFDKADRLLEEQELIDRYENVQHRWATYYMKKKEYDLAMECAENACKGERVLPQMYLLKMNIGIHLKKYDLVESDYRYIKENYKMRNSDICEILHTTMLLYKSGWEVAESGYAKIKKKNNPYAMNLRRKIIDAKLKDKSVSIIEKDILRQERQNLNKDSDFDVLYQVQCYDL